MDELIYWHNDICMLYFNSNYYVEWVNQGLQYKLVPPQCFQEALFELKISKLFNAYTACGLTLRSYGIN